ncbi:MAG: hypothetical protein HYY88_01355, partial [candidate division NC10 bacterium]|nr:hypothetical protein [candidate division NC10 bacterium]
SREEAVIRNPLKTRLARGEAVWGTFVFEYGSPAVPRIMKAAGWDYILLIMQVETRKGQERSKTVLDALRPQRRTHVQRPR